MTAAGLAVAVATAVGVSALSAGALTASDSWVSHLFAGDVLITSPVTQNDQVRRCHRQQPCGRPAPRRCGSSPRPSRAPRRVWPRSTRVRTRRSAASTSSRVIVRRASALENGPSFLEPAGLAAATGWTVGSQLPVETQKGVVYFTIVGVVSHSFPAGDGGESLVMADDLAPDVFRRGCRRVRRPRGHHRGSEATIAGDRRELRNAAVPVSVIASDARDALQHSIGLVLAVAVISVLIAMLAVVNTLLVNVRQGTRELALLRAVGLGSRQAMRRVLTEAGLLAACGNLDRCRRRLPHRRADAAGKHHADIRSWIRLSRRDRDRADPRRRPGRGRRHHRSSSQSGANLRAQRAATRVAGRCALPAGGGVAPRRRGRRRCLLVADAAAPRRRFPPAIRCTT